MEKNKIETLIVKTREKAVELKDSSKEKSKWGKIFAVTAGVAAAVAAVSIGAAARDFFENDVMISNYTTAAIGSSVVAVATGVYSAVELVGAKLNKNKAETLEDMADELELLGK